MITIKEIRKKYPDYNDLSDEQLVESLHKKHYSDMPKEEFYSKIGFNEKPKKAPSLFEKAGQFIKEDVTNLGKNLAKGYLNVGKNLANTPHRLGNLIGLGNVFGELVPEDYDYSQALGLEKQNENAVAQAIPEIATAIGLPGSTIPRMIAAQSAFGATQNKNPLLGAAEGAGGVLAGTALGKLLEKGINTLRPSKLLRGELSPEELAHNIENTAGTETGLGHVLQSPWLQRLQENVLPHMIGSSAEKTMQRNAKTIEQKGEDILHNLRGGEEVHENYGERIKNALKESANATELEKNAKFNKVNKIAEEQGVTTNRENLRKEAKSILSQIKSDPDLAQFTNSADIKLLEEIVNPGKLNAGEEIASRTRNAKQIIEEPNYKGQISASTGKPIETITKEKNISLKVPTPKSNERVSVITGKRIEEPHKYSLKNTDILRGKIGENAHEANIKGEKPKAAIYARLKKALEEDVGQSIEKSSHPELKNAHKEAMEFYKNEYAPFKDKDIQKFVKQGGDPDLILSHFLKMGTNDRVHLLRKVGEATKGAKKELKTTKDQNLLGNAYLSSAYEEGKINPVKLSSLYNKLGKRQKIELFGKENNEKLKHYTDLVHKNKEGFDLMRNPKTGVRAGHVLTALTAGAHLPTALGLGGLGKVANKLLTSESFREKLIKAMIADKKLALPKTTKSLQKGGAITAGQIGSNYGNKPMELEVIGKRKK